MVTLNDLNDSLVESRQYSESCERRVADLENSIYAQAAGRPTKGCSIKQYMTVTTVAGVLVYLDNK